MYINITDSESGNNKGSSGLLTHYLDKENRIFTGLEPEQWFNGFENGIQTYDVSRKLDNNIAKLCKDDAKFFLINISPSQKEIAFLKEQYGDDGAKQQLKTFAVGIMDEYAKNFNRPGIESNRDLLWFGKLENHRYYSHMDKEVKDGMQKRGDVKAGEQMHVQVIVSRKDIGNKIKLSPMNRSRGRNAEHSKKVGQFDRSAFKASGEDLFDRLFNFERGVTETFRYANAQKNGSLRERMAIHAETRHLDEAARLRRTVKLHQVKNINRALIYQPEPSKTYLTLPEKTDFLKDLLGKAAPEYGPSIPRKKKRKKKGREQEEQLTL